MKKTIIVYGSTTGTCEDIAGRIAGRLGGVEVIDVARLDARRIADNDNLILGTSTWGEGEVQDDWYGGLALIRNSDLSGKTVAVFGCGDSVSYADSFCSGMAELYDAARQSGATLVGEVSADGYDFGASSAVMGGRFVGLAIDEVNESDLSDARIEAWVDGIKPLL